MTITSTDCGSNHMTRFSASAINNIWFTILKHNLTQCKLLHDIDMLMGNARLTLSSSVSTLSLILISTKSLVNQSTELEEAFTPLEDLELPTPFEAMLFALKIARN